MPTPSAPHATTRDAGVLAPSDAALAIAPPPPAPPLPPQAACTAPTAAERTRIETAIHAQRKINNEDDAAIRPVCAERAGWLVEVATEPPQAWLVPAHGYLIRLEGWTFGPVYDVDGDGHPEATTIAEGSELKIWFDGPGRASYVLNTDGTRWLARGGKVLVGSDASAFEVTPGKAYLNPDTSAPAPPPKAAAYSCTSDTNTPDAQQVDAIAHMLAHGRASAPCGQLSAADKTTQESAIATALITRIDLDGVIRIRFDWGCTSHGEAPVVVAYDSMRDNTGAELWSVHDGKASAMDRETSSAPGEYSSEDSITIGPSGDFDGDGAAESIIEHMHHAKAHGTTYAYGVMVGGAMRALPSDLVVRAVVGDRDGVLRTPSSEKPHVITPCHDSDDPNTRLDCGFQPPAGYVKADSCGPWDWDKHAPQIVAFGTSSFAPVASAAVSTIVAATKAERAALKP